MKYRRNKVKREHSIIEDALQWLEELSINPEVEDIIPGVIETAHTPEKGVVYKYQTPTGCKLLLKSNGSIQEVFVVTKDPEFVQNWVDKHFPSGDKPRAAKPSKFKEKTDALLVDENYLFEEEIEEEWMREVIKIRRQQPQYRRKVRRGIYEYDERGFVTIDENLRNQVLQKWRNTDPEDANIADRVNPDVRSALEQLKAQLDAQKRDNKPNRKPRK